MIKVKTKDLDGFLKRCSKIIPNTILPIYQYIELKCEGKEGILTKTNNKQWCRSTIPVEAEKNCTVLLEYEKLSEFLDNCGEFLEIIPGKTKVEYKGKIKASHGVLAGSENHLPKFPVPESKKIPLPEEVMDNMKKAISCAFKFEEGVNVCYGTSTPDKKYTYIDGTDKNIAYRYRYKDKFGSMMLSPSDCDLLMGYKEIIHSSNERYNFFDCGNTTFASLQPACNPVDYNFLYVDKRPAGVVVMNNKDEMLGVLNYINRTASIEKRTGITFVEVKIHIEGNQMKLEYVDDPRNEGAQGNWEIENSGMPDQVALFNAKLLQTVLSSVPYNKVGIWQNDRLRAWGLFSPDDEDYSGIIVKLVPANN